MSGGPPTALPWWMGTAIVLVWLAVVAGIVAIAVRRRRRRRSVSRERAAGIPENALPDGRPIPPELGPADMTPD